MMGLMNALLETYDLALAHGLVDNHHLSEKGQVLLPIYHSNKKSNGKDIFEITINSNGETTIGGRFLNKEEYVVFPITEDSITRAGSQIAPHALCDELSYLSKKMDVKKNEEYLKGINKLLEYEGSGHACENFKLIGQYVRKNEILNDFLKFFLKGTKYSLDNKYILEYEVLEESGQVKTKTLDLNKIFISFKIEKLTTGDMSVTRDTGLHNFYITYVDEMTQTSKKLSQCNVTGKLGYGVERHRGIIGTAKLISISNKKETYYGRLKKGEDIYHVSYVVSQKIHNMLKYFLENNNHKRFIGDNAYIINWLSHDLKRGGLELVSNLDVEDNEDQEENQEIEEVNMSELGDKISAQLGRYFLGDGADFTAKGDFYILIIEKISNGRVSIKYFRRLSRSEAYKRVMAWYSSTNWKFNHKYRSPSIYEIVNFIYGGENNKGYLVCENKKTMRKGIERLLPCIIDSKRLPQDLSRVAFYKLSNKQSYKKSWQKALNIGCALMKKHKNDYENFNLNPDKMGEVKQMLESRSFNYGRLMAIYEKIELEAVKGKVSEDPKKGKETFHKITNADRLWSAMVRTPEKTRFILESKKIKPYTNILKKNNPGRYVYFDKLLTSITVKLLELNKIGGETKKSLNEEFILGYYFQKSKFYKKKED